LLNQVAQGTEFHFQSGLCGDWTLLANKPTKAALHLVTEGHCWFGLSPQQPSVLELNAGDIIFVNPNTSKTHSADFLNATQVSPQVITGKPADDATCCCSKHLFSQPKRLTHLNVLS
tara:strand:+ start:3299 stop:3649 length:351 start_codon:yes stop_codon:yes gene_type:complete